MQDACSGIYVQTEARLPNRAIDFCSFFMTGQTVHNTLQLTYVSWNTADVKKAYDNVWHARLLYKLKNIGITGMMFQYFKNFLSEKIICTRVGKTYSSHKTIDMNIPQGSVTAPILFNIIIHDLPKVLQITHMWRNMQMILLFGLTQVLESIQIRGW